MMLRQVLTVQRLTTDDVAAFIEENVLNVSHTVCSVSRTSLCDNLYSRQNFASLEWRVPYLSTEETSGRKIRGLCAIFQGSIINGCVSSKHSKGEPRAH